MIAMPEPGVYKNTPAAEYHSWPYLSNSMMTILHNSSPAHLQYRLANPEPPTDAMLLGSALHTAILEPMKFPFEYYRAEKTDKRTTAGKERFAEQQAESAGRTILDADKYDEVLAIRDAVLSNRKIAKILSYIDPQFREVSLVWDDEITGVRCKARLDGTCMHPGLGMVIDPKSTVNASRAAFSKAIYEYGYGRQGVHYLEGLKAHDTFLDHFVLMPFEKTPPYASALYRLDDECMNASTKQRRRLINLYAECLDSGIWPGYGEFLQDISLPRWATTQIEMESV